MKNSLVDLCVECMKKRRIARVEAAKKNKNLVFTCKGCTILAEAIK